MRVSLRPAASLLTAVLLGLTLALGGCASSGQTQEARPTAAQPDTSVVPVPRSIPVSTIRPSPTGVALDTVEAERFDQGRMWTFGYPPIEYFQDEYGFTPDAAWLEHARMGALRIPGCTASFASPHGLLLTNHHCARKWAAQVSRPGEDLLETGFYAETLDQERRAEGLYADQLIAIEYVTQEVEAALADLSAQTDAERAEARRQVFEDIAARYSRQYGGENINIQIVPLYDGARYSAYVYRRYTDVRLVMIPELALGYFGGDPDNFTYPRYTLDMALFRVYEDGAPLQTEYYFEWDTTGSERGEPVFVVGNPASTLRLETVAQLEFRRDVSDKALLRFLETRAAALEEYVAAHPERAAEIRHTLFGLKNARKLFRGRIRALNDPVIMARLRDAEADFRRALRADAALEAQYGGLIDSMAAIQQAKQAYAEAYGAFLLLENPSYSSATLRRALLAHRLLRRRAQGASEDALADLRQQLRSVPDQLDALNRLFLAARLADLLYYFGADSRIVQVVLQDRSPMEAARVILQNSVLQDSASTARALENGRLYTRDPAIQLAEAIYEEYRDLQSAMVGLKARQAEVARQLGRARFAVYGTDVPPDATFTLRIADGRVKGYEFNGTYAAPYTSYAGLYDHYYSYGPGTPWDLPERWLTQREGLDLSTPLNLVSTNDITGGNSGSPLLNEDLELVGLIFDGNIQSLAGDFIFLPRRMRAVSVDVRGMLEALDEMYDADRLVQELVDGTLVETEAAAED